MSGPLSMDQMSGAYLQIREWLALENKVTALQAQLEAEVARAGALEVQLHAAEAKASAASTEIANMQAAATRSAEETTRLLAAANEATRAAALRPAPAVVIPATTTKPSKKAALAAEIAPPAAPAPDRKPIEVIYIPQYDSAGKLSRIIAREQR